MRPVFSLVMMFAELSMGSAATPQAPPVRSTPQAPEVREVVPYDSLFAHCSRGGSGTLYVGVPAPKGATGIYAVLPANNREGIAVGVYDCGPNGTFAKRAAEAKSASSWSSVPGTTCRIVRLPNGQLVQVCQ